MSSDDSRATALDRLSRLHDCFSHSAEAHRLQSLAEQTEQLVRSVETFHMEAIRFRLFGLRRQMTRYAGPLPPEAAGLLDQASHALEAAGFQVR